MDKRVLGLARTKRRTATMVGWAVQWGTVRMRGTFMTEDPTAVPAAVVRFVAEQLGIDDEHFAGWGRARRRPTSTRGRSATSTVVVGGAARSVRPGGGVAGEQPGAAAWHDDVGPDGGRDSPGGGRPAARLAVRDGAVRPAHRDDSVA
ncbi:DUF4158 domain-containing protein [Streptomyces shenzhenensis]|uniref:DUF4158 domain-containing protein n=1 Tax=Streptomyces shenzhenensis TaxID=943815 RepID=UPI00381535AC